MDNTSIEWTDATWNCIVGCTRIAPGCQNCYAERLAATRLRHTDKYAGVAEMTAAGPRWTGQVKLSAKDLLLPLKWKRPRRIFVNAASDLFHEDVPDAWRDQVFAAMAAAPRHTYQVLTKRAARMAEYFRANPYDRILEQLNRMPDRDLSVGIGNPAHSSWRWLWLGVSVSTQQDADEQLPHLMRTYAGKVRFVSYEPALEVVDFRPWLPVAWQCSGCGHRTNIDVGRCKGYCQDASGKSCDAVACPGCGEFHYWTGSVASLGWGIVGGESGPGARPFNVLWARSFVDQFHAFGRPAFVKQMGAHWAKTTKVNSTTPWDMGDKKGGDMGLWREDLRVRELPC